MGETRISWCDYSWNPWIGCVKVSEGCRNCYAEEFSARRIAPMVPRGPTDPPVNLWGPGSTRYRPKTTWREPVKWNRKAQEQGVRRRVFCASLADVFEDHPSVTGWRHELWTLIRATPHLDWLLLTKRPENIRPMLPMDWGAGYPNVWLGVSAENQRRYNERVPHLLAVPAPVHFVSYEPALGPVDPNSLFPHVPDWIICGGESGVKRRPWDDAWARSVRDACQRLGITFFFKQRGARFPDADAPELDGRTHHEWPQPRPAVPA